MTSGLDPEKNLIFIEDQISKATQEGINYFFLPECFYSLSNGKQPTPHLVEIGNTHFNNISNLAKKYQVYLIGGSVAYASPKGVLNRSLNISPTGELLHFYDKKNLFRCDVIQNEKRVQVDEGKIFYSGSEINSFELAGFKFGQSICFDLRFGDHFLELRKRKVDVITAPSAFTVKTGQLHWHLLNRARAVENQCFMISAAQVGQNHPNVRTYGHSLVVNPWGEVLLDLGNDFTGWKKFELEYKDIEEMRSSIIMDTLYEKENSRH